MSNVVKIKENNNNTYKVNNNYIVTLVPHHYMGTIWNDVEKYLQKAVKRSKGRWTIDYLKNAINSNRYDNVLPFLEKLEIKALIRVVANLYVKTDKIETHPFHIDYEFPHKGALLSLNTCNGGTILKNNKKIKSVENTVIFFDPSKPHASTSATDVKGRFNILVNYF